MAGLPKARSTEEERTQKTTEDRDCGKEDANSNNSNNNGPDKEDCKLQNSRFEFFAFRF